MDVPRSRGVVRFSAFEVDLELGQVRKNGLRIRLQEQPFQVLAVLLTRPGVLVTREELRHEVWPENTFVEFDHALNTAVKKIRVAFSDDATTPRYVETIPKRGYRWIAPLQVEPREETFELAEERSERENAVQPPPGFLPPSRRTIGSIAVLILAGIVFAGLVGFRLNQRETGRYDKGETLLVVLPFENWSDDPAQSHFCRGLTEDLIIQLAASNPDRLQVAPDATIVQYEKGSRSSMEIGKELGADFILRGNVRGDSQRVRVSAELVRVRDQVRLWGDSFDAEPGDAVQLESEFAASVAAAVKPALVRAAR